MAHYHKYREPPYLSKYSSSLIIQLSHMTISCSCSGVLNTHKRRMLTLHHNNKRH